MNPLDLITLAGGLAARGLTRGREGSLSLAERDRVILTAEGVPLDELTVNDLAAISQTGDPLAAAGPDRSTEWLLHIAALTARKEAAVVVHLHATHAIALSLLGRSLPALTAEQYLLLGRSVPLVSYIRPNTTQLASAAREALRQAPAVLLQSHGFLVTAPSIHRALERSELLEESCRRYLAALTISEPRILSDREMRELDRATLGRFLT